MVNSLHLKALLLEKGYTQKALAKLLNLSTTTLNKKINNVVEFKASEIIKLCDILQVDRISKIFQ
ncbi:MAG: helix-turn-helix transcriptional regulator [Clostridia bacterium]|nr:helix-turn-helix transcriptional regulator [Clostridia bacterium]